MKNLTSKSKYEAFGTFRHNVLNFAPKHDVYIHVKDKVKMITYNLNHNSVNGYASFISTEALINTNWK